MLAGNTILSNLRVETRAVEDGVSAIIGLSTNNKVSLVTPLYVGVAVIRYVSSLFADPTTSIKSPNNMSDVKSPSILIESGASTNSVII